MSQIRRVLTACQKREAIFVQALGEVGRAPFEKVQVPWEGKMLCPAISAEQPGHAKARKFPWSVPFRRRLDTMASFDHPGRGERIASAA